MNNRLRIPLPEPWHLPEGEEVDTLLHEFHLELPPVHLLAGVSVELVGHDGLDDILLRHLHHDDLYTVVHLSWLGREELPDHPWVEFTGTLKQFHTSYSASLELARASRN